ncbi:hypothetical protein OUZ56_025251 [Daphnia magna]|uniref:Uncharacterized protein n=1 Tax=Daphnia magna TaxID=35525 RepID=A0ABQ9ZJA1_9CRUS|nr:hypothetical protein OUZ56_025251 [Daphnia magna]
MIHNGNGFEEDFDGVLVLKKYKYMFVGRATEEFRILLLSHILCACKTKGLKKKNDSKIVGENHQRNHNV